MLDNIDHKEKYGVCLDTCHLYESSYDIVNDLEGVLGEFEELIGLEKVKTIHLNDSKNPLGARKERYEKIGKGTIGLGGILNIVIHPRLKDKPFFWKHLTRKKAI